MKKLMTLALVSIVALGAQAATAASYDGDNGKKKGRPSFVDEKHRAHAEWKREKEYEKALKKQYKKDKDDDDRWERDDDRWERSQDRDRWEKRREDERWEERRERERWEERRRQESNRPLGEILREGVRTGKIEPRTPTSRRD